MNTSRLIPIPEGTPWPSGGSEDIAKLPITAEELALAIGLPLLRGVEDGLGPWAAIGGRLPSGGSVEYIHYEWAPGPAAVILRADKPICDFATLDEALQIVGVSRDRLTWISPLLVA